MNNRIWKNKKRIVLIMFIILSFALIISYAWKFDFKNNKNKYPITIINYNKRVDNSTLPTNEYKTQLVNCYLNRDKTKILLDKNYHIVKTRNIIQNTDARFTNFAFAIAYQNREIYRNFSIEITLTPCHIFQLFYNLKIWAGRLTNDKSIVQFMYNALRITSLGCVYLNGRDRNYQVCMSSVYRATQTRFFSDSELTEEVLMKQGEYALLSYRQPYLRNEMNFTNDQTLFSHYAILQGLRHRKTMTKRELNLFPIFKVFDLFKDNIFYQQLFRKSNNAKKNIILNYQYFSATEKEEYYTITST